MKFSTRHGQNVAVSLPENWKKVLLDYVSQLFGGDRQWLPPARRYVWKKLYLPSRAKKQRRGFNGKNLYTYHTTGFLPHDASEMIRT